MKVCPGLSRGDLRFYHSSSNFDAANVGYLGAEKISHDRIYYTHFGVLYFSDIKLGPNGAFEVAAVPSIVFTGLELDSLVCLYYPSSNFTQA